MATLFQRTAAGIEASFDRVETDVLRGLCDEIGTIVLFADRDDDVVRRLLPDAHRDDAAIADELRQVFEPALQLGKVEDAEAVVESLSTGGQVVLDEAGAEIWLRALNDQRLAIGTRIGVTEDDEDEDDPADDEERAALLELYRWLGWLQQSLIDVLSDDLQSGDVEAGDD